MRTVVSEETRASSAFTEIVCAHLNKKYFNDDGDDRELECDAFVMFEIRGNLAIFQRPGTTFAHRSE